MEKIIIFAFFGKSGAGKDTIARALHNKHLDKTHFIVSCTTRPRRDYEVEGQDYFFLNEDAFAEQVLNGKMLEATSFNDWFYGTSLEQIDKDKINLGVFNIQGIECLLEDPRLKVTPILIMAPNDKERLFRILHREEDPNCIEICRRFLADEKDFSQIPFNYAVVKNLSKNKIPDSLETLLHEHALDKKN